MNACFATGLMQQFHRLFGVLVLSLFSCQMAAYAASVVDGNKKLRTIASVKHADDGSKLTLLNPKAIPAALPASSGKIAVLFSVPLTGKAKASDIVYLRRVGDKEIIAMNDLGKDGDFIAKDGIHGVNVQIDTDKVKPDSCLSYETYIKQGRAVHISRPVRLCVSSLPVGVAKSDVSAPAIFSKDTKAVADEVLLSVTPTTSAATIRELASSINASVVGSILPLNFYQLKLSSPASADRLLEIIAQLKSRKGVVNASINAIGQGALSVNDPAFNLPPSDVSSQHGLKLVLAHNDVTNANAWDAGFTGNGVTVVVLDTGIESSHSDLNAAWTCQDVPLAIPPLPVPVVLTPCSASAIGTTPPEHGTEVTGVIAAKTSNNVGVAGVASGSGIHAIKMRNFTTAGMIAGFQTAAGYVGVNGNAKVVNASFNVVDVFTVMDTLCASIESVVTSGTGAIVVNAAGNQNINGASYPARCNDLNINLSSKQRFITVSNSASFVHSNCGSVGVDQRCAPAVPADTANLGSNYGSWVSIAAPGSVIRTTMTGNTYSSPTGSSFSTPMVSGAVAILASCGMPMDQIKSTLTSSANVTVPYPLSGANPAGATPRLDIHRALSYQAPTAIGLAPSNTINENNALGATVATLTATDPDICDKFTFALVAGAGSADNGSFTITGSQLTINGAADYETKPSYSIRVRVTDFGGLTFEQPLTVNVVNVNEAPAGTNNTVTTSENTAYTFSAANFGFTDPLDSPSNNLSAVIITTLPAAGQLKLGAVPVVAGQSVASGSLGSLTFMPATNASGPAYASFTFQVVDDGGTANGGVNTDPTPNTLTIDVTPVMTAPTGTPIVDPNPPTILNRKVPQVLSVDTSPILNPDSWPVWGYQWRRSGAEIGGATNSTYPLDYPDVGSYMSVCVKYSYDSGVTVATLCSGTDAIAVGDPHITTVDGLHYDFQGAGEFVALRGAKGMEIQLRMAAVSTAPPFSDSYTGLTSGVSVNTAVAARVGKHRVTYQPDSSPNAAGGTFVLRVDGVPTTLPVDGIDLGDGGRVMSQAGGIQIDFPDQTTLMINTSPWPFYGAWWLHVSVFHTSALEGIMGARSKGSWLPRLPNGSALGAMPAALHDRYVEQYVKFADSWRVNKETTLFDYAKDTSTETYTNKAWPTENGPYATGTGPVAKPLGLKAAQLACGYVVGKNEKADCVFDVRVMGNAKIAQGHILTQKIRAGLTAIIVRDDRGISRDKEMVTFTATVARHAALTRMELDRKGGVPTGTVQFTLNGNSVEKPVRLDAKGQAQLKLPRLKIEKQTIGARYIPTKGSVFFPSSSFESARLMVEGKK